LRWNEVSRDRLFNAIHIVGIDCLDGKTVQGVTETVELLSNEDRDEQKLSIVQILASLKNSGDGEFFRKNNFPQLTDCFLFFGAFFSLPGFNFVEDLAEIAGRVNSHLIADGDAEFLRQLDAEHGRIALQIKFTPLDDISQRNDMS